MIRANISDTFPLTSTLIDEDNNQVSGETVRFDVRHMDDTELTPSKNGFFTESTHVGGIYKTTLSINNPGSYLCYVTCSGFPSSVEEIIINQENIYDVVKSNRNYNLSVEDIKRTNIIPSASQLQRKVPFGSTDYILNVIKEENDSSWLTSTTSGIVYAHYMNDTDKAPYKMAGPT